MFTDLVGFKGGDAGRGKVLVLGKTKAPLHTSLPTGIAALLSGETRATAQLITSDAECFGGTLGDVKRATSTLFKAVGK
jgi:hypothetical protein